MFFWGLKKWWKQSINAQHFYKSFHLLPTPTLTFFECISYINHFFYNIYTIIQLTTSFIPYLSSLDCKFIFSI